MKKMFLFVFLLSGCMVAPQKSFQVDPDVDIYPLSVSKVEVIPMTKHFDALPHVENQLPTSPEDAVQEWAKKHLKSTGKENKSLWIIVEKAEMLKTDLPKDSLFEFDEESYSLNYKILIQIRQKDMTIQKMPVDGKGFITVKKRASLSSKEKGWAWLIQKMLVHLKTKMKSDLQNVFIE